MASWKRIVYLVFLILNVNICCNGELVLYVQSHNNVTPCPNSTDPTTNCRLLSEYATDSSPILFTDTTLVFLPGVHSLTTPYQRTSSNSINALRLQSFQPQLNTTITCEQNGEFYLVRIQTVELVSLEFSSCNMQILQIGNATFRHSTFARYSESTSVFFQNGATTTFDECTFIENEATILVYVYYGLLFFSRNKVYDNFGALLYIQGADTVWSDNVFINNGRNVGALGIITALNVFRLTGTNIFTGNVAEFSGVLYGFNCRVLMDDNAIFTNNTGYTGGVLSGVLLHLSIRGYAYFGYNIAINGGVFILQESTVNISGVAVFESSRAYFGGALHLVSSQVNFLDKANVTFRGNSATSGGALFVSSGSTLNFAPDYSGSLTLEENSAQTKGGAVFIQDYNTLSYCYSLYRRDIAIQTCSFLFDDYIESDTPQILIFFKGNRAGEAGAAIYGGAIGICSKSDGHSTGDSFYLRAQFEDEAGYNSSTVSSEPFILYVCEANVISCTNCSVPYTVFPGSSLEVSVASVGQFNGPVPTTVEAVEYNMSIRDLEINQRVSTPCSVLSYTVYAMPGNASLQLFAEGPCFTLGLGVTLQVQVLDCPPGFVLETSGVNDVSCVCDPRLLRYTASCISQNGTITRDGKLWVGYDRDLDGLILYSFCPFDYCILNRIYLRVEDSDAQCNHNRAGLLCGECSEGLSLLLGSSKCDKCSNDYLALLLFFAAAGLMLVALLLLLNLTVAVGTINGLIFYANIVAANEALIFPPNSNVYLDILRVFIAWINLDFGIESCFYDGMDAYALTWLQYAFPIYIWFLVGIVFVISHFSSRISKILGSNPVAILDTLILLSYTKLIRTIIEASSFATLDYPEGQTRVVWLYDGNVPYGRGRHLVMVLVSLLILLLLFFPYTIFLLGSQWLQTKSHWKYLSWLGKPQLQSFLDAYHAPYKPKYRYWTGVLLVVRLALLLASTNPEVTLLVVQIFVFLMQSWVWVNGGIYRKWYVNVLEAFFFLNLGLLAASSYYVDSEYNSTSTENEKSSIVSGTLVTAAAVVFVGIIIFHISKRIRCPKRVRSATLRVRENSNIKTTSDDPFSVLNTNRANANLRESILAESTP